MRERFRPASVFAPVDRRALRRFASSCFSEIIVRVPAGLLPIIKYHVRQGKDGCGRPGNGWDRRWGVAGIGDAGKQNIFPWRVNEKIPSQFYGSWLCQRWGLLPDIQGGCVWLSRSSVFSSARPVSPRRLNVARGEIAMRIAAGIIVVIVTTGSALRAQSPAFEVATVKVNRSGSGASNGPRLTNGRLSAENGTLKRFLQVAYDLNALQISGPGWLDSDRFDLAAKSPQGVPDSDLMPMLQSLLKERFQLTLHRENKEMPVYDLIVAKEGLKISVFDPSHIPPTPPRNGAASMIIGPMTISGLAKTLTPAAGRPVIDKTGLEGRYFCAVTFSPLKAQTNSNVTEVAPLDIFAAVQQQLGLKLEPAKALREILVVDHAERIPREN